LPSQYPLTSLKPPNNDSPLNFVHSGSLQTQIPSISSNSYAIYSISFVFLTKGTYSLLTQIEEVGQGWKGVVQDYEEMEGIERRRRKLKDKDLVYSRVVGTAGQIIWPSYEFIIKVN
jgi:hypothetical protein